MLEDPPLFGDTSEERAPTLPTETPIADWQVDLLRKALDVRGLATMTDRQQAIEVAAGRAVESLRTLTHDEAMQVLTRLGQHGSSGQSTGSAWDDRDEDTWIDRL